MHTCCQSLSNF